MSISAAEASRLTGKSKQAVINAIKGGKISAIKNVDGAWQIEPVELFRHYQAISSVNGNGHPVLDIQLDDARQVEVKWLRELVDTKNDVIAAQASTIDVLSQENARLTAVIAQLTPPKARIGWWQRLLQRVES